MSLHRKAMAPKLAALLERLMREECLKAFYLVGGTSLALRFGHRESDDIDLFTHLPFDAPPLAEMLKARYGLTETAVSENTVNGVISGIKVDLIAHRYPLLAPVDEIDGLRLASIPDVAAMKLNAVANRGSKKDFWDCAELLRLYGVKELLQFCGRKYESDSVWNVEKSLCYFGDVENDPDPRDLRGQTWDQVKQTVLSHVRL